MAIDRATILSITSLKIVPLEIPEWGGTAYVREMRASEREAIETTTASLREANRPTKFRSRVAVASLCDEQGVNLFKPEDVDAVDQLPVAALDRVVDCAFALSRFTREDVKALEKN